MKEGHDETNKQGPANVGPVHRPGKNTARQAFISKRRAAYRPTYYHVTYKAYRVFFPYII
jgi:hypothetical protein